MAGDVTELILNRTWRPQLAVTAMDGYPLPENGGNVLLPYTTAKLSMRLPPTCDAMKATMAIKTALEEKAPYAAEIEFDAEDGQSGSIPFMGMLGEKFPKTQFVVTGVLGPHSNAHGPNEFLHIPTAKKVTACIASVLEDHANR